MAGQVVTGVSPAISSAVERLMRRVADFPSSGVQFCDLTPVLADADGFDAVVTGLMAGHRIGTIDYVAGLDARGFLLAGAVDSAEACATPLWGGLPRVPVRVLVRIGPAGDHARRQWPAGALVVREPLRTIVLAEGNALRDFAQTEAASLSGHRAGLSRPAVSTRRPCRQPMLRSVTVTGRLTKGMKARSPNQFLL